MKPWIWRALVALAAAALAADAGLHWILFGQPVLAAIGVSNLPPTLMSDFKALWVADVTTLLGLAAAFAWAAGSPTSVSAPVILILAAVPAALGLLVFAFGGPGYAATNMLVAAGLAALGGAFKWRTLTVAEAPDPSVTRH
jgi:hypothetical protein